jgi:hypothetical protein
MWRHQPDPVTTAPSRPADTARLQRRRLRFVAALAGARIRLAVVPEHAVRRRQRVQLCSAARILTASGVRVRVVQPERPWPRHRSLILVTPDHGRLADLAVLTAVPRTTPGWSAVADRVFSAGAGARERVPAGALRCHVTVSFRSEADVLVVEVRLLAAEEQTSAWRTGPIAA